MGIASPEQISHSIVHPDGPKVLQYIELEFGLDSRVLQLSWDTLAEIGNISSGTAIYMLDKFLTSQEQPASGAYGLMVAMEPGFSQEAILLQW